MDRTLGSNPKMSVQLTRIIIMGQRLKKMFIIIYKALIEYPTP
jgi:hypothetical protein